MVDSKKDPPQPAHVTSGAQVTSAPQPDFELEFYKLHRAHEVALNNATATYEQSILRLVLILNASSIGAILGLMNISKDSLITYDVGGAKRAIYWWAVGIVFAFLATAAGYWSQRAFTQAYNNRRRAVETRNAKVAFTRREGNDPSISITDLKASLKKVGINLNQKPLKDRLREKLGIDPLTPERAGIVISAVADWFVEKAEKKGRGAQRWEIGSIVTGGLAVSMAIVGFCYAVHAVHKREPPAVTQNSTPTSPMIDQPQKPPLPPPEQR